TIDQTMGFGPPGAVELDFVCNTTTGTYSLFGVTIASPTIFCDASFICNGTQMSPPANPCKCPYPDYRCTTTTMTTTVATTTMQTIYGLSCPALTITTSGDGSNGYCQGDACQNTTGDTTTVLCSSDGNNASITSMIFTIADDGTGVCNGAATCNTV
uniref:Uncharacterized protein n=1 Tax=Acrobeloides nanus TaxID=290746 RepID=A0A914D6L9_9BILA